MASWKVIKWNNRFYPLRALFPMLGVWQCTQKRPGQLLPQTVYPWAPVKDLAPRWLQEYRIILGISKNLAGIRPTDLTPWARSTCMFRNVRRHISFFFSGSFLSPKKFEREFSNWEPGEDFRSCLGSWFSIYCPQRLVCPRYLYNKASGWFQIVKSLNIYKHLSGVRLLIDRLSTQCSSDIGYIALHSSDWLMCMCSE